MVNLSIELPEDFLNEEVRWGYTVSHEMKKVWAVELDLLHQLINICNKYHLRYLLSGGSMLGAVRHNGFIPWDDDIDVYMFRPDYDELMKHADEFNHPYFLQNNYTSEYCYYGFSRLHNSETTAILPKTKMIACNKGIFVDIFPLDGIEYDTLSAQDQLRAWDEYKKTKKGYNCYMEAVCTQYVLNPIVWFKTRLNRIKYFKEFRRKKDLMQMYDNVLTMCSNPSTDLWGNRTLRFDNPEMVGKFSDFDDTIDVPFEFMTVKIPRAYDKLLTYQFGDYMTPQQIRGFHSAFYVLDADRSYLSYTNQVRKEAYKQAWIDIMKKFNILIPGSSKKE